MSKERIILYGVVIFVLSALVYFSYSSQQSVATKARIETVQETREESSRETVLPVTVESDNTLSDKAEISDNTSAKTEDAVNVDENAPTVERNKLVGGADVEWEEPKPKDPNNKFGEPPL